MESNATDVEATWLRGFVCAVKVKPFLIFLRCENFFVGVSNLLLLKSVGDLCVYTRKWLETYCQKPCHI